MSEYLVFGVEHISYNDVADLDPLRLDAVMRDLPNMNADHDVDRLRLVTLTAVFESERVETYSKSEAYAAMRDLDFLASSLIRHGDNPVASIDGLEAQFLRLSKVTETIPRGTVFTYAAANPTGLRRRSFTGSEAEESFIDAVAQSVYKLDGSVDSIGKVRHSIENDETLADSLLDTELSMQQMVESIVTVKRTVSPEFFTNHMRPYFDGMTIGGKEYTGAGGAQMQLLALDYMLWGCSDDSKDYRQFYEENYQYLTPAQQDALQTYDQLNGSESIIEYIIANQNAVPLTKDAALSVLKMIKKFRYPHRRVAQENFKIRSQDAVGSGNHRPDILDTLIVKVDDAIRQLEGDA